MIMQELINGSDVHKLSFEPPPMWLKNIVRRKR